MENLCKAFIPSILLLAAVNPSPAQSTWVPGTAYPTAVQRLGLAVGNGYVYAAGGTAAGVPAEVSYGVINPDGTLGAWMRAQPLPPDGGPGVAFYNGWLYVALGSGKIYRAPAQPDGSLGAWQLSGSIDPTTATYHNAMRAHNGYLYVVGRVENSIRNVIRYAAINSDGTLGSWQPGGMPFGYYGAAVQCYNGRMYLAGGLGEFGFVLNLSYSAALNSDGSIGAWRPEADLPSGLWNLGSVLIEDRLVLLGGMTSTAAASTTGAIWEAQITQPLGALAGWTNVSTLPGAGQAGPGVAYNPGNGTLYLAGGTDANGAPTSEIWRNNWKSIPTTNTPPVAYGQSVAVHRDGSVPITLSATDADNDPLSFTIVNSPTNGTLTGTAPNLVYDPVDGYTGVDAFTFKVADGRAESSTVVVSIQVSAGNGVPLVEVKVLPEPVFAGVPGLVLASANGGASLTLDASGSIDPDGEGLSFQWLVGNQVLGDSSVLTATFGLGDHMVTVLVSDGSARVAAEVTFTVIGSSDAIAILQAQVQSAAIPAQSRKPLQASLNAAAASLEKGHPIPANGQLGAFQAKTTALVGRSDPSLAGVWVHAVQQILEHLVP